MSNTDTGGPAFPQSDRVVTALSISNSQGMTMRDYFAAKAMQGFAMDDVLCSEAQTAPEWFKSIAEASYELADAMLSARGTGKRGNND